MIRLTSTLERGRLRGFFRDYESLSHHRIQSGARQRDSPARFGQKERWRRPAHHQNVPRIFAPNLQRHRIWVPELKKFVAYSRHGARSQDNKQAGRLQGTKKVGAI